jgi:hypothetical protein
MVCQKINGKKCKGYLTDEGEPAWCFRAGQPAEVAVLKCRVATGEEKYDEPRKGVKDEQQNK